MQTIDGITMESVFYNATNRLTEIEKHRVVNFLFERLDTKSANKDYIRQSIDYATKECMSFGGFVIVCKLHGEIIGAVIVNQTGMEGYMPENILVYIAVSENYLRKGVAKCMMDQVLNYAKGNIAIHMRGNLKLVPIFEKLGFKKSIEEMLIDRK